MNLKSTTAVRHSEHILSFLFLIFFYLFELYRIWTSRIKSISLRPNAVLNVIVVLLCVSLYFYFWSREWVVCLDFSLLSLSINLKEICQCHFSFGLDLNYAEEHIILCRIGPWFGMKIILILVKRSWVEYRDLNVYKYWGCKRSCSNIDKKIISRGECVRNKSVGSRCLKLREEWWCGCIEPWTAPWGWYLLGQ